MLRDENYNWTNKTKEVSNILLPKLTEDVKSMRSENFSFEEIMYLYITNLDDVILRCIRDEKMGR